MTTTRGIVGWDGTRPTRDEQNEASKYLVEMALTGGDGKMLRFTKVLMDARDAALADAH